MPDSILMVPVSKSDLKKQFLIFFWICFSHFLHFCHFWTKGTLRFSFEGGVHDSSLLDFHFRGPPPCNVIYNSYCYPPVQQLFDKMTITLLIMYLFKIRQMQKIEQVMLDLSVILLAPQNLLFNFQKIRFTENFYDIAMI